MNMSVNKSVTFVILLISSLLKGQVLKDTVAFEYLKTVQIAPVGAPLDFPAYELGVKNGLEFMVSSSDSSSSNSHHGIHRRGLSQSSS